MRTLLSVVFLSISIVAFAQIDRMIINFRPAFMKRSQLIIQKDSAGYTMSIKGEQVNEVVPINSASISRISDFLPTYFIEKQRLDSIEMKEEEIREEQRKKGVGVYIANLDGITIRGYVFSQQTERGFEFWSPNKTSVNYTLMMLYFDLMKNSFVKPQTINYISGLRDYFPK